MELINKWPEYHKKDVVSHYCPGCGHGIVHRIVAELLEEMDLGKEAYLVCPAGCAVLAYLYLDFDIIESAHGRGTAIATGAKRANPNLFVISYQGDGDLSAIGTAETIHSANRGENISVIFINNAVYGMTGGQMAPTSLIGQSTMTSPAGRNPEVDGYPLHITDVVAQFPGVVYAERVSVSSPAGVKKTKKAIRNAFETQQEGLGYSIVEVLSPCPTNWKMDPVTACKWVDSDMAKEYKPGLLTDKREEKRKEKG